MRWEAETYDLALLDLGLPLVDGLTLLRHFRESNEICRSSSWCGEMASTIGSTDSTSAQTTI